MHSTATISTKAAANTTPEQSLEKLSANLLSGFRHTLERELMRFTPTTVKIVVWKRFEKSLVTSHGSATNLPQVLDTTKAELCEMIDQQAKELEVAK